MWNAFEATVTRVAWLYGYVEGWRESKAQRKAQHHGELRTVAGVILVTIALALYAGHEAATLAGVA
jgi:hypothetical protein